MSELGNIINNDELPDVFLSPEWFSRLFGFHESALDIKKYLTTFEQDNLIYIKSKVNNKCYSAGKFEVRRLSSFKKLKKRGNGKFHFIVGNGENSNPLDMVDVICAECNPENDGATFQVASNFNCLDHAQRPSCRPPKGTCSDYYTTLVQGPPASVACGPALIYRQYFLPLPSGKIGQLEESLNMISDTDIIVKDGYCITQPDRIEYVSKLKFDWENLEHYPVALQKEVDVTMNRCGEFFQICRNQRVHQVFCSAMNFNIDNVRAPVTEKIAYSILKAEYKGTILAAWECSLNCPQRRGSNKLFLTLVGGGVFLNPIEWIADSIRSAKKQIADSGLDVYLVCFNKNIFNKVYPFLKDLVKETKGTVVNATGDDLPLD